MNLAEKIFNERTKLDLSQEQFAEQLGVSRQAVSKWETGQSLPDLDKIVMMSQVFGVTTDYLLGEGDLSQGADAGAQGAGYTVEDQYNQEKQNNVEKQYNRETEKKEESTTENKNPHSGNAKPRYITDEEAEEYCTMRKKFGKRIGLGVFLCIIGLASVQFVQEIWREMIGFRVSNPDYFDSLAVVPFLICVAIAVAFFIVSGLSMAKYEYMEETNLTFSPDMKKRLQDESEARYKVFTIKIAAGVCLCILGVVVCAVFESLGNISDDILLSEEMGAFYLLVIVAVAVYQFVTAGIEKSTYDILLQKNEHRLQMKEMRRKEKESKAFESVAAIYWCIVTAIYLAYSFITFDWGRSWIFWPVAGCLFGAIAGVMRLMNKEK